MVQHACSVSYGSYNIKRLNCHFKIDDKQRLYFLFVTSIRLQDIPSEIQIDQPKEKPKKTNVTVATADDGNPVKGIQ